MSLKTTDVVVSVMALPDTVVTTSDVETKEVVYVTSCNDTRVVVTG